MRRWILIAMLLCASFTAGSQNFARIRFLKEELKKSGEANQFERLTDLAWEYRFFYPDSTIFFAEKAIQLKDKLKLDISIARALNFIGVAYAYKGNKITSYQYYSRALANATEQADSIQLAYAQNNMGRLLLDEGLVARSYDHLINAIDLFKKVHDSTGLAYAYQSLANLYRSQKDYSRAEVNLKKALGIRLLLGNTRDIQAAYTYLGLLYQETGESYKSNRSLLKADSATVIIGDEINQAEVKTLIAKNHLREGNITEAEKIFKQGFEVILRANNVHLYPRVYLIYGDISLKKGDVFQAQAQYKEALAWAKKNRELERQMEAYLNLYRVSVRLKNKMEELTYHNQYLLIKDSVSNLEALRQVEHLQFEIYIHKEEKEIEQLKLEKAEQKAIIAKQGIQNTLLIIVAATLLILGIAFWITSRKRREANARLARQNAEIENQREEIQQQNEELSRQNQKQYELNHELNASKSDMEELANHLQKQNNQLLNFAHILSHNLRSPVGNLKSLLTFYQGSDSQEDKEMLLTKFSTVIDHLTNSLNELMEVLRIQEDVSKERETLDFEDIFNKTKDTLAGYIIDAQAKVSCDFSKAKQIHYPKSYLESIMLNLFSNAIKYRSPDRAPEIHFETSLEMNQIVLIAKDNGLGIDMEKYGHKLFGLNKTFHHHAEARGVGLYITKTQIEAMGGAISAESEVDNGTTFKIVFSNSL